MRRRDRAQIDRATGGGPGEETAMTIADKVDAEAFWRDGWQIVPGVYSKEEIAQMRAEIEETKTHGGDLLANPKINHVMTDGRLVQIAQKILGSDEIVYGGDSAFTVNSSQHGFHKDNVDRTDPNGPDWQNGRYTMLRFGIYLQDHHKHTGGLNLRHASHNTVSLKEGKNIYVRSKVGDVAVWSMRTSHSGNGTLLRFPPWTSPDPAHKPKHRPWQVAPKDGDRMAVFVALGLNDAHHDRYVEYLKTREYIIRIWSKSPYDEAVLEKAKQSGLTVRDAPREVAGRTDVGQNVDWKPLPY
jgi:hypothetical protein